MKWYNISTKAMIYRMKVGEIFMKKMLLMTLIFISFFALSGCNSNKGFDQSVQLIGDAVQDIESYYSEFLSSGQLTYNDQSPFVANDNLTYSSVEIRSSWVHEDYEGSFPYFYELLHALESIISDNGLATFDEIESFNAYESDALSLKSQEELTGFFTINYISDEEIRVKFTQSNGDFTDMKIIYQDQVNSSDKTLYLSLFSEAKLIDGITRNYYYEFNEDDNIKSFSMIKGSQLIEQMMYYDLQTFERYIYNKNYYIDTLQPKSEYIEYIDYVKGILVSWEIHGGEVYQYIVRHQIGEITTAFSYHNTLSSDHIEIYYNLANYEGWDRFSVYEGQIEYPFYNENDELIDFQIDEDEDEWIRFDIYDSFVDLTLHKVYDKETITDDDVTLKSFGLTCYDNLISLEFINNHQDNSWVVDHQLGGHVTISNVTLTDLFQWVDEDFSDYIN